MAAKNRIRFPLCQKGSELSETSPNDNPYRIKNRPNQFLNIQTGNSGKTVGGRFYHDVAVLTPSAYAILTLPRNP